MMADGVFGSGGGGRIRAERESTCVTARTGNGARLTGIRSIRYHYLLGRSSAYRENATKWVGQQPIHQPREGCVLCRVRPLAALGTRLSAQEPPRSFIRAGLGGSMERVSSPSCGVVGYRNSNPSGSAPKREGRQGRPTLQRFPTG